MLQVMVSGSHWSIAAHQSRTYALAEYPCRVVPRGLTKSSSVLDVDSMQEQAQSHLEPPDRGCTAGITSAG